MRKAKERTPDRYKDFPAWWAVKGGFLLEAEVPLVSTRRFRVDYANRASWIAIELDGGSFMGGRHTSGVGFERDCVKFNVAAAQGWLVFRVTPTILRKWGDEWFEMVNEVWRRRIFCQSFGDEPSVVAQFAAIAKHAPRKKKVKVIAASGRSGLD